MGARSPQRYAAAATAAATTSKRGRLLLYYRARDVPGGFEETLRRQSAALTAPLLMFLVDDIIFVNDVDLESEQLHRLVRPFASGPLWSPSLGSACCERGACTAITAVTARDRQLATSSEHQLLLCYVRFRRIDSAIIRCLSHPSGAAKPQGQCGLLIGLLRLGTTGSPRSVCSASAVCSLTAVCTSRHVLALYALLRRTDGLATLRAGTRRSRRRRSALGWSGRTPTGLWSTTGRTRCHSMATSSAQTRFVK